MTTPFSVVTQVVVSSAPNQPVPLCMVTEELTLPIAPEVPLSVSGLELSTVEHYLALRVDDGTGEVEGRAGTFRKAYGRPDPGVSARPSNLVVLRRADNHAVLLVLQDPFLVRSSGVEAEGKAGNEHFLPSQLHRTRR